ncbi:TNF receptor-associated factor 6-B-like isoform X2 [Rhopilema esculentum]|uniref:TNF receptor-associated factor 6-B-like isoform X2 n=1 Tax=Rhopilema esculentum TaxID=499914 RepID=UPI0031D66577
MDSLSPLAQALIDSIDDNEPIGGFAYDFVGDVHEEYKCCICLEVMKEPYQLVPCGHCCCRSCLGQLLRTFGVKSSCPIDRQAISMMFPDNNTKRKIQNLKIFCERKNWGCQWKEELSQYQPHSSDCLYVDVLCSNEGCGEILPKALLEVHESSCRWRMVQCEDCNAKMHSFELVEHDAGVCPFTEVECPEGCGATLVRALDYPASNYHPSVSRNQCKQTHGRFLQKYDHRVSLGLLWMRMQGIER